VVALRADDYPHGIMEHFTRVARLFAGAGCLLSWPAELAGVSGVDPWAFHPWWVVTKESPLPSVSAGRGWFRRWRSALGRWLAGEPVVIEVDMNREREIARAWRLVRWLGWLGARPIPPRALRAWEQARNLVRLEMADRDPSAFRLCWLGPGEPPAEYDVEVALDRELPYLQCPGGLRLPIPAAPRGRWGYRIVTVPWRAGEYRLMPSGATADGAAHAR